MFDIVEKVNRYEGIYNCFDWPSIRICSSRIDQYLELRRQETEDYQGKLESINHLLRKHIAIPDQCFDMMKLLIPL
jgi:hypothetical protein